ncbi:MAG: hypothetical protein ACI4XF_06240 [Oscillospiraceae bacterium]
MCSRKFINVLYYLPTPRAEVNHFNKLTTRQPLSGGPDPLSGGPDPLSGGPDSLSGDSDPHG